MLGAQGNPAARLIRRALAQAYLAAPSKVQYLLARLGMKVVLERKTPEPREFLRH
jgi:hypothetical protein